MARRASRSRFARFLFSLALVANKKTKSKTFARASCPVFSNFCFLISDFSFSCPYLAPPNSKACPTRPPTQSESVDAFSRRK
jgi:hypothetical protein